VCLTWTPLCPTSASCWGLTEARHKRLGSYSGGMRQRVGIAQALLNDPQLLIVDEPTVGLDPTQRARFRNLLSELSGERIVILSTHIVSDIEATALEIAVINDGRLVIHTTPEELLGEVEDLVWTCVVPSSDLPALREPQVVSRAFARFVVATGQPKLSLHDLRHTHATQLRAAGENPKLVSQRLGHSSVGFTLDTYAHVLPGQQASTAENVARLVFSSRKA
jgi:ABC-type multidrug transport system ATPase subunit